jgi:hypothetical protein
MSKLIFKNEEAIKFWANSTYIRKDGDLLIVQHYQDKLYYYFELIDGVYNFVMTSINKMEKEIL